MRSLSSGALGNTRFRLLLTGQTISELGSAMFPVALVGLVLVEHGPGTVGLLLAVRAATGSLFGLLAGVVVAKTRKTTALIVNDVVQIAVAVGFATQPNSFTILLALATLSGCFDAVFTPASGSLLPLIVPREHLQEANAARSIANQAAGVAGPAAAGALIALTDLTVVFLVDAATFLASIAALALLGEQKVAAPDGPGDRRGSFRLGLGEVTKRPWVVAIIAVATFQAPLTIAPGFTLLPIVSAEHYTTATYGIALSCMALGQVAGGLVAARWAPQRPGLVSLAGVLPYPLVLLGLAAAAPAPVILAGYFLVGIGFMMFGVYWYTALQREIPQEELSVVLSIDQVGSFGLEPLGYAAAGALAESIGARPVLLGAGIFGLTTTLIPLSVPGVPRLSSSPPTESDARSGTDSHDDSPEPIAAHD